MTVYRWHPAGHIEILIADRSQRVRAAPFDALELCVGMLFGGDDDRDNATTP